MKLEIGRWLKRFLQNERIELYVAANDNVAKDILHIELESIKGTYSLLFETKRVLGVRLCDTSMDYYALRSCRVVESAELDVGGGKSTSLQFVLHSRGMFKHNGW